MFTSAKQAEILRASQKDEYYGSSIKSSLAEIVQNIGGPRYWLKYSREFDLLADVLYFTLTTFGGYQTLGEEYVNILIVNETLKSVPPQLTRACMILLQCCVPYAIDRALLHLEKSLENNTIQRLTVLGKEQLTKIIPIVRHVIVILHRCNLAAFYIKGVFYHLAKRFTGIHYILVRSDPDQNRVSNYKVLGWLCVVQLVWTFLQQIFVLIRKHKSKQNVDQETMFRPVSDGNSALSVSSMTKCALCLETRRSSTATPCGHLFCWQCIFEWCKTKPMCPLCREEFQLSRLVYLKNYDSIM